MKQSNRVESRARRAPSMKLAFAGFGLLALSGCGLDDDARACNPYACSTSASLSASVPCNEAMGSFGITLCHGDDCSDGSLVWTGGDGAADACTGDLAAATDGAGFDEHREVCARREGGELVFNGTWAFGREGLPITKRFTLRITDETSGELLLDQSANASFEPGPWYDHCHECLHASLALGPAGGSCAPPDVGQGGD